MMTVEYLKEAAKELEKLDKPIQKQIIDYMNEVKNLENPRSRGKGLTSNLSGLWRYRVGNYRIICNIQDDKILITVVRISHRSEVYKTKK